MGLATGLTGNTPRSQSLTNQLQPRILSDDQKQTLLLALRVIEELTGINKIIARLMLVSGARVSEILSLTPADVQATGHVLIRARKRSRSRVVYLPDILPYCRFKEPYLYRPVFLKHNYWRFYRAVRLCAGSQLPRSLVRTKVSNLFRSAASIIAHQVGGGDLQRTAEFLGHNNSRSTLYYLKTIGALNG